LFTLHAVLKGSLKIDSNSEVHKPFHTVVLSSDENEGGVAVEAVEDNTEFLLASCHSVFGM
jgi:hypothetical protein